MGGEVKFVFLILFCFASAEIGIKNVDRIIDLKTHVAKCSETVLLENAGSKPVDEFEYVVDRSANGVLAFIEFRVGSDILSFKTTESRTESGNGVINMKVKLGKSLSPSSTVSVSVISKMSHAFKPFPAEITQEQKQFVLFVGNMYFYSPYSTKSQKTVVHLPSSSKVESTDPKPSYSNEGKLTYGPFSDRPAYDSESFSVHFGNNKPFLVVTQMERLVEVSHWGNIAVEETYEVVHQGAKLRGSFSRYDYQRSQGESPSVKDFTTILPASAKDVYYRDEIGNISTSNMRETDEAVELVIRPRFPLFGGWKTQYTIGYNVPSYQFLYSSGSQYALKMPFVDHVFDNQVVDDFKLRVILPEGSVVDEVFVPYDAKREKDEIKYTYLDTNYIGRPVVVMTKQNLVDSHIQNFQLDYRFPKIMLLCEPALLVGAMFLLFCTVMVVVRLDFSISTDEATELKLKVSSFVSKTIDLVQAQMDLFQQYDQAVSRYKSSKSNSGFQADKKKLDSERRGYEQALAQVIATLKTEGSEDVEKVIELQRLTNQYFLTVTDGIVNAERLLAGKLGKSDYIAKIENADESKINLQGRIDTVLMTL